MNHRNKLVAVIYGKLASMMKRKQTLNSGCQQNPFA